MVWAQDKIPSRDAGWELDVHYETAPRTFLSLQGEPNRLEIRFDMLSRSTAAAVAEAIRHTTTLR